MNANFSVFLICVEGIIYLLIYNLHDCTFKPFDLLNTIPLNRTKTLLNSLLIRVSGKMPPGKKPPENCSPENYQPGNILPRKIAP